MRDIYVIDCPHHMRDAQSGTLFSGTDWLPKSHHVCCNDNFVPQFEYPYWSGYRAPNRTTMNMLCISHRPKPHLLSHLCFLLFCSPLIDQSRHPCFYRSTQDIRYFEPISASDYGPIQLGQRLRLGPAPPGSGPIYRVSRRIYYDWCRDALARNRG